MDRQTDGRQTYAAWIKFSHYNNRISRYFKSTKYETLSEDLHGNSYVRLDDPVIISFFLDLNTIPLLHTEHLNTKWSWLLNTIPLLHTEHLNTRWSWLLNTIPLLHTKHFNTDLTTLLSSVSSSISIQSHCYTQNISTPDEHGWRSFLTLEFIEFYRTSWVKESIRRFFCAQTWITVLPANYTMPAFTPQPQKITALWLVLILPSHGG